jgi:HEAT repeat protein
VSAILVVGGLSSGSPTVCVLPALAPQARALAMAAGAQRPFEDVAWDLRSEDPAVRIAAMRTLAAASYPEAMAPMASLLTDPIDDVQLEAIDTLMSFVVVDRVVTRRHVALVVEVRDKQTPEAVFDMGPFVLLPRPVVPEVVAGLAGAMRDNTERVRIDATYALGVLARPGLDDVGTQALVAGMSDPEKKVRLAAVRVAGGLRASGAGEALVGAINDKQPDIRFAAMRAVGDVKETRAVQALTEQFDFYERKGAYAQAALDGLARIGAADSVPLFQEQLTSKDALVRRYAAEGLARSGQASLSLPTLESGIGSEKDAHTALAFAYALQSIGRPALDRLIGALADPKLEGIAMLYLTELGPPVARPLGAYLKAGDDRTREDVAMVLGLIGGPDALVALDGAKQDPNTDVARAVERGIARARMGQ